jgi:hypothetical protein
MDREEDQELRRSLVALKLEHRQLDEQIERMIEATESDQLKITRMKKKKLVLKDEILRLEDRLLPDIIA